MNDTKYILNPNVIVRLCGEEVEIWNTCTGERFTVTKDMYDILRDFKRGNYIDVDYSSTDFSNNDIKEFLYKLIKKSILVKKISSESYTSIQRGLFNLPSISFVDFFKEENVDVALLGIPYDKGCVTLPGSRFGPEILRKNSWEIGWLLDSDKRVTGYYDFKRKEYLIRNLKILDIGNIGTHYDLNRCSQGEILKTIGEYIEIIYSKKVFPVIIGGDHSITAGVINGIPINELGIIQLDAHSDISGEKVMLLSDVYHNNFIDFLIQKDKVKVVFQLGLRSGEPPFINSKVKQFSLLDIKQSLLEVLESLPKDIPYYVSVDVDVLDPLYMPNTGSYVPEGLTDYELIEILEQIGKNFHIVGADFVEYMSDPQNDQRTSVILTNIILKFISSIYGSEKR